MHEAGEAAVEWLKRRLSHEKKKKEEWSQNSLIWFCVYSAS